MKAVLLVMLASVLAWVESLPADIEFLFLLPFGVVAVGFVSDVASRLRGRHARATPRRDRRGGLGPRAMPRAAGLATLRRAVRRRLSRSRSRT
jgi:hypothetical protein